MLTGLGILGIGFFLSSTFELFTSHWLLSYFFDYLILIVIVLFQDDLRRALTHVGKNPFFAGASAEEEREMVPLCRDQGVGLIPWSPLARGYLARAPEAKGTKRSETDRFGKTLYSSMAEADQRVLVAVDKLAKTRNLPHAQIAMAWLLRNDVVTAPIVGATKMEHLETAVGALVIQLSREEVTALEAPYVAHPIAGFN